MFVPRDVLPSSYHIRLLPVMYLSLTTNTFPSPQDFLLLMKPARKFQPKRKYNSHEPLLLTTLSWLGRSKDNHRHRYTSKTLRVQYRTTSKESLPKTHEAVSAVRIYFPSCPNTLWKALTSSFVFWTALDKNILGRITYPRSLQFRKWAVCFTNPGETLIVA